MVESKQVEKFNPLNLKKEDLAVLFTQRCKHHHLYAEHPQCYIDECKNNLRIGFLDIESSNLKADFGIMLSYCIKEAGTKTIYGRAINKNELDKGILDKDIVRECIKDIGKFNLIVTYYGTKFDLPFIRSRAMYWNMDFPVYGSHNHKDVYYMVKSRLCIHRNRLEDAARLLGITGKNHIDGYYWITALTGNAKALGYILDHNKRDVLVLESVYNKMKAYAKNTSKSI